MSNALADAIFWIAVASCTIAQVAILRSIFTAVPHGAPTAAAGAPRVHRPMEIVWAILPAVALALVLGFTWRAMQAQRVADAGSGHAAGAVHGDHAGHAHGSDADPAHGDHGGPAHPAAPPETTTPATPLNR